MTLVKGAMEEVQLPVEKVSGPVLVLYAFIALFQVDVIISEWMVCWAANGRSLGWGLPSNVFRTLFTLGLLSAIRIHVGHSDCCKGQVAVRCLKRYCSCDHCH